MPPLRKIDFTQDLAALARLSEQQRHTCEALATAGITMKVAQENLMHAQRTWRGEPIPDNEPSFFALREGEKPRRKRSNANGQ
jgi:hypothetical protein